jgi:hypothetical protein
MEFHTLQSVPLARSRHASRRSVCPPVVDLPTPLAGCVHPRRQPGASFARHYPFTLAAPGISGRLDFRALLPGTSPLRVPPVRTPATGPLLSWDSALMSGFTASPRGVGASTSAASDDPGQPPRGAEATPGTGSSPRTRASTNRDAPRRAAEAPQVVCLAPREISSASQSARRRTAEAARVTHLAIRKQSPTNRGSPRNAAEAPLVVRPAPRRPSTPTCPGGPRRVARDSTDSTPEPAGEDFRSEVGRDSEEIATDPHEVSLPRQRPSLFGSGPALAHGFASGTSHVTAASLPLFGR